MAFRPKQKAMWKRPGGQDKVTVVVVQVIGHRVEIRTRQVDGVPVVLWVNMDELEEMGNATEG